MGLIWMRLYAKTVYIATLITLFSFITCLLIHYVPISNYDVAFWLNICLSIFSGSLLTTATSLVGYFAERRRTLERFRSRSIALANILLKYDTGWSEEEKVDYLLNLSELDKSEWHDSYGEIFFLFDLKGSRNYIGFTLYKPMRDFMDKVTQYKHQFLGYKNTLKQISDIENKEEKTQDDVEWLKSLDNRRRVFAFSAIRDIESTLTCECRVPADLPVGAIHYVDNSSFARKYIEGFNDRYLDIMYGKSWRRRRNQ